MFNSIVFSLKMGPAEQVTLANLLSQRISEKYQHPLVAKWDVVSELNGNAKAFCLGVSLRSHGGAEIVQDVPITDEYFLPGMYFNFNIARRSVQVENTYVSPRFQGQGIGTGLVRTVLEIAKQFGFESAATVAETDGVVPYWVSKHCFEVIDPSRPRSLEKKL